MSCCSEKNKNTGSNALVQIGGLGSAAGSANSSHSTANNGASSGGISRRNFLKVLGSAPVAGAALAGCSDDTSHKALPNVFGQEHQVPGVAVWYNSTCMECSAGCGISVRTREGRAVKIEGNREHPLSKGGLCALGQSGLQALYDPDRVRQPLKKNSNGVFEPISWKAAIKLIGSALKFVKGDLLLFTGEQTGSLKTLSQDFVSTLGGKRVVYDPMQASETAKATELVFGERGIPRYRIDKADLVVNFGADFLETWESPVQYARSWADGRRGENHTKVIHIEPRLSLTGANADKWISPKAGSEISLALFILKSLIEKGKTAGLSGDILGIAAKLTKNLKLDEVSKTTGVSEADILLITEKLLQSKKSLVLSGGAAGRSKDGVLLATVTYFINFALGNIGETIDFTSLRKSETDLNKVGGALEDMREGRAKLVFVANGVNPIFSLPSDYGFKYAVNEGRLRLLEALNADSAAPDGLPFLVSFSSFLDETAKQADLILPSHHSLEDWGDVETISGVRSVVQPVMTPVFDTKGFGDQLLSLAGEAGKTLVSAKGVDSFQDYVKEQWVGLLGSSADQAWQETLDRGGKFVDVETARERPASLNRSAIEKLLVSKPLAPKSDELVLYPYFSVKSFDGRAANRPWLQEMPDPIVQAVWDSWGEIHTETAKKLGLKQGDTATVRNRYGEINVPVYVTDHVVPGVVAVPIGQGHSEYGRYAREVSDVGNVFTLIPKQEESQSDLPLVATTVKVIRARKKTKLVVTQGSDSQHGRHLARTLVAERVNSDDHSKEGHGDADSHDSNNHDSHHHEPKQMYTQREHPIYDWVMAVDLASCTGCSACVAACYAENNIPVVGKEIVHQGREMSWLKIDRYFDQGGHGNGDHSDGEDGHGSEELQVSFMPMMCQHCNSAPCEPVCPVYAPITTKRV